MRLSDKSLKHRVFSPAPKLTFVLGAFLMLVFQSGAHAQSLAQPGKVDSFGNRDRASAVLGAIVTVTAPPNQLVSPGSSFNVPITTSDLSSATTGVDVISYDIVLTYDPAVIVPLSPAVSGTGTISEGGAFTINTTTPGTIIVSFFRADPLVGAGTLFNFRFTAIGIAGQNSPVTWTFFRFNEGNPDDNAVNGLVTILLSPTAAGASVSGSVVSSGGQPVYNVRVTLTDGSGYVRDAITNPFGFYAFEDVPAGSVYVISAASKRFTFQQRVITLLDDLAGVDLVAEP